MTVIVEAPADVAEVELSDQSTDLDLAAGDGDHVKRSAAYHQAGHAVALFLTGLTYKSIHIDDPAASLHMSGMGRLVVTKKQSGVDIPAHTINLIAAAGPMAEIHHHRKAFQCSRDIAWTLAARTDCAQSDMHAVTHTEMHVRARHMVKFEWEAIDAIAQRLYRESSLTYAEVTEICSEYAY
ncbi:hypothetical protein [Nocardia sp. NPDC127526]|uniref:hypothetical protein n=1 Tax=Nocardia sp. NPDC127526 TaxID=3345393 RepID=UPI003638561C